MSFADHLGGDIRRSNKSCVVCEWYGQLDDAGRAAFDNYLDSGGAVKTLWRKCTTWDENPLTCTSSWFDAHVNEHRGRHVVAS